MDTPCHNQSLASDVVRWRRRDFLKSVGFFLIVAGCNEKEKTLLIEPAEPGLPTDTARDAVMKTSALISAYLGLGDSVDSALMGRYVDLKTQEQPSYRATYEQYARGVQLPPEISSSWIASLAPTFRTNVVGELAVMSMMAGGLRAFGYQNIPGYAGGPWHNPAASRSFRIDPDER